MRRGDWSLVTVLISGVLMLAGCGEEVKPNAQEITASFRVDCFHQFPADNNSNLIFPRFYFCDCSIQGSIRT